MILFEIIINALSVILCLFTLISVIRHDYWIFRIFEFPRLQKWWINLVLLIISFAFLLVDQPDTWFWFISVGFLLTVNFLYLSYQIFPFTFLAKEQLFNNQHQELGSFSMIVSNVYQYNRDYSRLISVTKQEAPDILLVIETDQEWIDKLIEAFSEEYPYRLLYPLANTYGMGLLSRLPLEKPEIRFLIKKEIPSFSTVVKTKPGLPIRLFCLHPEPPVPTENSRSTERDAEILLIAREASEENMPVVVAGDLNDVAWSYTTELFLKVSGLLDPRRGRGMFNTFHAKYAWMRWPLDHIFCSSHFLLNRIQCLPNVGSDHLPIAINLALTYDNSNGQKSLNRQESDEELAKEKIDAVNE